jgi:S-adenosylmethionine:tRNA ribosyltransferase-isomerase
MQAARARRAHPTANRLVIIDPTTNGMEEHAFAQLPALLAPGDLMIVNDAATRPSSLALWTDHGHPVEARLLGEDDDGVFDAVLFGAGDWRTDTDVRPAPPHLRGGDVLTGETTGRAVVVDVADVSPRWVRLRLDDPMRTALYVVAQPVQYSYMANALSLADVQTPYASRPWASEMPSAGRALTVGLLVALRRSGVDIARVTAAAGLSATGDPAIDARLPLPERYQIPTDTVAAIAVARGTGGRVIAVGTSTARALEAAGGRAGEGTASLIIGPGFRPRVIDGILSGMHEVGTSHDAVLRALAPHALLDRAIAHGRVRGLLVHELGDHCLVLPSGSR